MSSTTKKVDLWGSIGLGVAGAGFLAVLVSDLSVTPADDRPALPLPFHSLAGWLVISLVLASTAMKLCAWTARRQDRMVEQLLRKLLRSDAPVDEALPDNVQAFELGRRVERQNGHR